MSKEITTQPNTSTGAMVLDGNVMANAMAFADMMSKGVSTVPKHLQGCSADCLAVTMQAMQWNMNPFAVAQKTHLVSGSLGYEAQLVNAVISSSTAIEGRFHYEYSEPKTWEKLNDPAAWVKVGAIIKDETEIQWGEPLFPATVTTKNSPLWKSNPKQQCSYLALKYWARLYTPAVIMGVYTSDELLEIKREEIDITPINDEKPESTLRKPATESETVQDDLEAETTETNGNTSNNGDETVITDEQIDDVIIKPMDCPQILQLLKDAATGDEVAEVMGLVMEQGIYTQKGTEENTKISQLYQARKKFFTVKDRANK